MKGAIIKLNPLVLFNLILYIIIYLMRNLICYNSLNLIKAISLILKILS